MIREFCAENFTHVPTAIKHGANRIELCDNLAVGGTTVSQGVLKQTLAFCQPKNIPVMPIIRPRGGNFIYSSAELAIMESDIYTCQQQGATGIVIGCLTEENWLAEAELQQLFSQAAGLSITFHMAFDELTAEQQLKAIDWLSHQGVDRILTHGGPAEQLIIHHLEHLQNLIDYAQDRITIMPGGGVTYQNYQMIQSQLNCREVHGTKIVPLTKPVLLEHRKNVR